MGNPTGFMQYTRAEPGRLPPGQRIHSFEEFLLPPDEEWLHLQSARCMDCGVPFCQAGMLVQGGSVGCPLNNPIPETNDLVYRGKYEEAYRRLIMTHPFPEITGRVCPALCEGSCTLGEHDSAVTVKSIERFLADWAREKGLVAPRGTLPPTGRRVAVVGSGPAGLACADVLSRRGHEVTVLERADRPGGFLMYGIPQMKLDKRVVLDRVELLTQQGVRFQCGVEAGVDADAGSLVRDFDAVVLCTGARQGRALTVPGAEARGVCSAVDYLSGNTRRLLAGDAGQDFIDAAGRDVVVVGGGDTGTDCVATAIRQGARSVAALEIMPAPPAARADDNPWPLWPRVQRTDYGHEEALALFGREVREYETTVKEITAANGAVTGLETVRVRWEKGPDGRMAPRELAGTRRARPAQLVLVAMGFSGVEPALPRAFGIRPSGRGTIEAGPGDSGGRGGYHTGLPTVFAAGDARRGPSLVVWAIHEGIRAARECHRTLMEK